MNQYMMGEYCEKIVENGIYLPEKFQFSNKRIKMLLVKEGKWMSIQLFDEIEEIQELLDYYKEEHIEVIKNEIVEISDNGYFRFPELFLQEVSNDTEVIVAGMLNHVEIITLAEMEEMDRSMKTLEEQINDLWDF